MLTKCWMNGKLCFPLSPSTTILVSVRSQEFPNQQIESPMVTSHLPCSFCSIWSCFFPEVGFFLCVFFFLVSMAWHFLVASLGNYFSVFLIGFLLSSHSQALWQHVWMLTLAFSSFSTLSLDLGNHSQAFSHHSMMLVLICRYLY